MGTPLAREISRHQDSPCGSCNSPVSFRFVIATNKAIRPRRCMACSTPSKPQPRHQPPDQHGLVQHVVAQAPPPQHGQRREQPHHRPLHPMQVPGQHPLPASQAPPHYAQPREHWHVVLGEWLATDQKWSEDHASRVKKSLEDNIFPAIGTRNIAELGTRDLLAPIKAVELSGRLEVASRLQQRTTAIMRYAVQSGLIDYNPAQEMAGAVASSNRQHRPALELKRIPELLEKIDDYTGRPLTRWATELTLLIFIRSSELRFARWSEIDFETSMWTIPPEREPIPGVKHSQRGSKMRTPHLVPLSKQALAILKQIKQFCGEHELIFIGDHDPRKPMSENTVNSALRVMGYDTKVEVCGHGFRTMACSSLIESGL